MSKTTAGDAFQQKKGDLYHYAEAVEVCLKAADDEIVHIENYGDISTLKTSYEVKDIEQSLSLGSYQIWNTLKNWVLSFGEFVQFDKLILLTTSSIVTDKTIPQWNNLTGEQKFLALESARDRIKSRKNPSKEKLEIFKKVFNYSKDYTKDDLITILDKFYICIKSVNPEKKYEELKQLESLKYLNKNQKRIVIDRVISTIFRSGLEGKNHWVINIAKLNSTITTLCSNLKIKLPTLLKKYDNIKIEDFQRATFIMEMERIELDSWDMQEAIGDYCKTQDTIIELLSENILYQEDIEKFKYDELYKYLIRNKKMFAQDCNGKNVLNISKKNYYACLNKIHLITLDLINNEDFFQRGNIHALVDEEKHKWLIDEY